MMGDISKAQGIYIVCGYTDMRRSINGLAALVQSTLSMDPFSRQLFLFCGKRADRMKVSAQLQSAKYKNKASYSPAFKYDFLHRSCTSFDQGIRSSSSSGSLK
jgi:hypothetical protein